MATESWPQSDNEVIALLQSMSTSTGNKIHCEAMKSLYYLYRTTYNEQESLANVYMAEGNPINNPAEFVFPSFQTDVEAKEFICEIGLGKSTKPTTENETWTIAALSLYAMKRERGLSIQASLEEILHKGGQ